MAKAAVRSTMESYLRKKRNSESLKADLVIITGKGKHSANNPILQSTTLKILQKEFGVDGRVDDSNEGRIIVDLEVLRSFVSSKSW